MTTTSRFQIKTFPTAALAGPRADGRDEFGVAAHRIIADGGEPLRCCLRNAVAGERCLLFGYAPPLPGTASPYQERGAVYAHAQADDCGGTGAEAADRYPADWYGRAQVLRAYDERGWIHPATTTHDGSDPVGALQDVLSAPGVVEVHSRNIGHGCFMFAAVPVPVNAR